MAYTNESSLRPRLMDGIGLMHVLAAVAAIAVVGILLWLTHTPITLPGLLIAGQIILAGLAVLATATYRLRATGKERVPATVIFNVTLFLVGGLIIISFATYRSGRDWAASMIWCLACLALGSAAGFLFGIPRSRVPGTAAHAVAAATSTQSVSSETAIEQISDWLTKIIVGVGLANLTRLPSLLDKWAGYAGLSLDPSGGSKNFALGMILYFCILGLVSGYLLTQMFLLGFVNQTSSDEVATVTTTTVATAKGPDASAGVDPGGHGIATTTSPDGGSVSEPSATGSVPPGSPAILVVRSADVGSSAAVEADPPTSGSPVTSTTPN
jgi:hypothetical protein